jgi:hypothetical protein
MLKLATGAGALVLAATAGGAAAPRVIAIVPTRGGPVVEALDARTLAHPRGGWTYHLEPAKRAAISGTKVAVATGPNAEHVVVLNAATGRILYSDSPDASVGLFGIGGGEFVAVGFNCSSGGCGDELTVVGSGGRPTSTTSATRSARCPRGWY